MWLPDLIQRSIKNLLSSKKKYTFLLLLMSLMLITTSLVTIHLTRSYTSDDVVIQTVAYQHTGLPGHGNAWLGEDNYIIKLPFYFLAQALFSNSRKVIFATLFIFDIVGFSLFFYSSLYFIRKFKLNEGTSKLALLWLASLAPALVFYFLFNPNLRNLEIGISFLVLMLYAKYLDNDMVFSGKSGVLFCLGLLGGLALFFYSDPLFAYMLGLPLGIFLCVRILSEKYNVRLVRSLAFLLAAFASSFVIHRGFVHFGIITRHTETSFIPYSQLWHSINQLIANYFYIFWGKFLGRKLTKSRNFNKPTQYTFNDAYCYRPFYLAEIP